MYYPEGMTEELLRSAVQRLGQEVLDFDSPPHVVASRWRAFVEGLVVVPVRGEDPNPSDSGVCIRADGSKRPGSPPEPVLRGARGTPTNCRASITAGSGAMSCSSTTSLGPAASSLQRAPRGGAGRGWRTLLCPDRFRERRAGSSYCPLVTTAVGAAAIARLCPEVTLSPAHFLPPEYSAFHPESRPVGP